MGLNIKNPQAESAIRDLALARGVSLTEAVIQAVQEASARDAKVREAEIQRRISAIEAVQDRVAKMLGPNPPTWAELEEGMYDEHGLPA